ncbi:hypothetical protein [Runella zeae]|uniref:hypothetical protein n=1 Tax=Runella zeae TaxID=94255 RepID=UPI002351F789|nr:hypothetical protein [Runella zeae]
MYVFGSLFAVVLGGLGWYIISAIKVMNDTNERLQIRIFNISAWKYWGRLDIFVALQIGTVGILMLMNIGGAAGWKKYLILVGFLFFLFVACAIIYINLRFRKYTKNIIIETNPFENQIIISKGYDVLTINKNRIRKVEKHLCLSKITWVYFKVYIDHSPPLVLDGRFLPFGNLRNFLTDINLKTISHASIKSWFMAVNLE